MLKARQVWQVVLIISVCWSSFPVMPVAPVVAQITGVATPVPAPTASATPVTALPFVSPVSTPVVTATPAPQATVTPGVTETVDLTVTQSLIGRGGGHLISPDRRVQLEVPPDLFAQTMRVRITPQRTVSATAPSGMVMQFDLTVHDPATDAVQHEFEQPITLTVDLNGLVDRAKLLPGEHLALFHESGSPDAPWAEIVNAVEIRPGVLQARVSHFSGGGGGSSGDAPAGWHLKYNPPVASTFSGAATFNYPLEVGAGRNGLQPGLSLAYNSRGIDGLLSLDTEDMDGVPPGWSLDLASISRNRVETDYCGNCGNSGATSLEIHPDFSLALNGANYDLKPATTAYAGRYYVTDNPGIYVERRNDPGWNGTWANQSHEYWLVKTGDGVTYRFGYNSDSEQTQTMGPAHYLHCADGGYCGATYGTAAVRWRVDAITDVYGNQMTVTYQTRTTDQTLPGSGGLTAEHTFPQEIRYNFVNGSATSRVVFTNTNGVRNWVDRIWVYQGGLTNKVREYQLGWDTSRWLLTAITQTNAAGTQWLPPTTLDYTDYPHDQGGELPFAYLSRVANGYGGATEFSYMSDGRRESVNHMLLYGYSYRVGETRTYDGLTSSPARVQYDYGSPCYNATMSWVPGVQLCRGANPPELGPLVGHALVTATTLGLDGSPLARTVQQFNVADNNSPYRGREITTTALAGTSNSPLTLMSRDYVTQAVNSTYFTILRQQTSATYDGGLAVSQTVTYTYDNYGNTTEIYEVGDPLRADDDRRTTSSFAVITTVTSIPAVTYWPRSNPTASSGQASAGNAIDASLTSAWSSNTYYNHPNHPEWLQVELGAARSVDVIKVRPEAMWTPSNLVITYYTGSQWLTAACQTHDDASGDITLKLTSAVTATSIKVTFNVLGGWDGEYRVAIQDIQFGRTPGPNTGQWIVSKPGYTNVYTRVSATLPFTLAKSTWFTYDNRPQFYLAPITGTLTAVRAWTGTYPPQFVDTRYTYDQWGNRLTATTFDDLGTGSAFAALNPVTTTTAFDGMYHLYPVQITNPKNQAVQTAYDYALGVPITVTAANGAVTTYQYDPFGRLLKVIGPGDTAADPRVLYTYWDTGAYVWTRPLLITVAYKPGSPALQQEERHFYDGLGREIQTHAPVKVQPSGYSTIQDLVISRRFDARGLVVSETVPYAVSAYTWNGNSPYTTVNLATAPKTLTEYDALGRTTKVTQPDGTVVTNTYFIAYNPPDPDFATGKVSMEAFDANGHVKRYSYDAHGNLIIATEFITHNVSEYRTHYTYDALGSLTQVRDHLGNTTVITYDVLGRKKQMVDPDMGYWTYAYDNAGNLKTQTDARNQTITFNYDELNRLTSKSTGVTYTYDGGNSATYSSGGDRTILTNDGRSYRSLNTTDIYFTLNAATSGVHDLSVIMHQDSPVSDPYSRYSTVQIYIDGGQSPIGTMNLTSGVGPDYQTYPSTWMLGPAQVGKYSVNLNAGAHTVRLHRVSGLGWAEIAQDGSEIILDNAVGQRTSMTDPSGSAKWVYDTRGRVVSETKAITIGTTANLFTTQYGYDVLDRVITTTYPTGEVVTQTYNNMGALENVRQSGGQWYATNLDYNANGSLARLDLGNNVSTMYGYFGLTGNAWDVKRSSGLTNYSRLWRARTELLTTGQPIQDLRYAYDGVGNVTYVVDTPRAITGNLTITLTEPFNAKNTSLWTYDTYQTVPISDGANNVVKNTGDNASWNADFYRSQYALANSGGMRTRFKVDQASTKFIVALESNGGTYQRFGLYGHDGYANVQFNDGSGWLEPTRVITALQPNTWYVLTIVVDTLRGLTLEVYPENNPAQRAAYNIYLASGPAWRFHAWTWTNAATGSLYLDDYKEFNGGATVTPDERMQFTYDALDRLLGAHKTTADGYDQNFTYDAIGNIQTNSGTGNYWYQSNVSNCSAGTLARKPHAVTDVELGGGMAIYGYYTYDCNGNMLQRSELVNGQTKNYTQQWDAENRLTVVTNTTTTPNRVSRFTYDGDGARVLQVQISGTQIITTAYAGAIEVQITGTQRITKTYYSAGSQLIAMRQYTTPTTSVLYFLHSDHLGSVSLTTDASGTVLARQKFDAWGNLRSDGSITGTMPTDIAFTGQRSDSTGLMYYRARYYAQSLGRFISADTMVPGAGNPQAFNRYAYTNNNPLKYTDPTGHKVDDGCDSQGCSATQNDIDKSIGAAVKAERQVFYARCAQGGGAECATLHEVENIGKVAGVALVALGVGMVAGTTGIAAGAQDALATAGARATVACAGNPVCATLFGLGGAAGGKAAANAQNAEAGLGDLTSGEAQQIQNVVNEAGRPLEVVGSAAEGARRGIGTDLPIGKGLGTRSDIDYLVPPSSLGYYTGLDGKLPSIDPMTGIIPGVHNPWIGPAIRFEPWSLPYFVPGATQ